MPPAGCALRGRVWAPRASSLGDTGPSRGPVHQQEVPSTPSTGYRAPLSTSPSALLRHAVTAETQQEIKRHPHSPGTTWASLVPQNRAEVYVVAFCVFLFEQHLF